MEQITDRDSNIDGQSPTTSSAESNVSPMAQHYRLSSSSSPHGTKRKLPNDAGQSDERVVCFDFIAELKSRCAEKDHIISQLRSESNFKEGRLSLFSEKLQSNLSDFNDLQKECINKDAQLAEMASKIKRSEEEILKQDSQLKAMADEINKLKEAYVKKDDELKLSQREVTKLQAESVKKDERLEMKERTIVYYQQRYNEKDFELAEKTNLIKQMRERCVENESDVQIIPEELEYLEDKIISNFNALFDCAQKHLVQKQYVAANVHYKKAIELEKATLEQSDMLAMLFVSQAFCFGELNSFSNQISAANSALKYDSNCKDALYNRAFGYFKLKHYSNARQDVEKILQMDSNHADAQKLLEEVQKCINEAT